MSLFPQPIIKVRIIVRRHVLYCRWASWYRIQATLVLNDLTRAEIFCTASPHVTRTFVVRRMWGDTAFHGSNEGPLVHCDNIFQKWRGKGEQKAVISLVDSEGIVLLPRSGTLKTEQTYTEYILAAVRKDEQVTPTSHGQTRALRFWVC